MTQSISHITFIVNDLEKTAKLLKYIFDAKEVYSSDNKNYSLSQEKFFLIGDLWVAIMKGDALPSKTYNHIAFKIEEKEYDAYLFKISKLGLEIKLSRKRIESEGKSIYFYDYDNHLFELHTGTLEKRLKGYSSNETK